MARFFTISITAAALLATAAALPVEGFEADGAVKAEEPEYINGGMQLIRAADQALQGGRLVEAQALLDRLPREVPSPDGGGLAMLLRAELLLVGGQAAEAKHLLEALPDALRESCRAAAARAMMHMQLGNLGGAGDLLVAHADDCRDDVFYWRAGGRMHLALGDTAAAVNELRRASDMAPGNDAIKNDLAVALIANGDPAEAAHILTALASRKSGAPGVAINLDYANGMLGRMPMRGGTDSDAQWSQRLQYAGAGARRSGRTALAEALLAEALIESPRHDQNLWRQYTEVAGPE